jgi:hypothetical protein
MTSYGGAMQSPALPTTFLSNRHALNAFISMLPHSMGVSPMIKNHPPVADSTLLPFYFCLLNFQDIIRPFHFFQTKFSRHRKEV